MHWGPDANMGRGNFEGETGKPLWIIETLRGHLCKDDWTDRGAISVEDSHGPKASCITSFYVGGPDPPCERAILMDRGAHCEV